MISYIIGTVQGIGDSFIILDNNGIGYKITMPGSSIYNIGSAEGDIKVYTYMSVREDDVSLFGFLTMAELEMFKLLITVSGIGPKGAIGILSSITVDELRMAIAAEDSKLIAGAKGVGSKSAQKIVVELKGKIEKNAVLSSSADGTSGTGSAPIAAPESSAVTEAINALEALGFGRTASVRAVNQIEGAASMTASDIISQALAVID